MPTYDYECARCGHTFDTLQSMSDAPLTKCPECGRNGLKRLIGGGLGVIFKGSGFYVTDSRSNGGSKKSAAKTADTAASGTSDGSSKSGGETKKDSGGTDSGASEKAAG